MTDDMAARDDSTELRLDAPAELVTVLDGVSLAQKLNRNQLVLRVLSEWAAARVHEATVLQRLGAINPPQSETTGKGRA
jgi:hypothetical protein